MPRSLLIYALVLPLAILLGYMLATPTDLSSFSTVLMIFSVLTLPIILRYHHFLVALTWNAALIVFFLPGQPTLGLLMILISLTIAVIDRTMRRNKHFVFVPAVIWPLLTLSCVVFVTAELTGGIGGRVLGSETWGAKRYLGVITAVLGYFALTSQRIPKEKGLLYVSVYFLGGTISLLSDLVYMAGPNFYFLFLLIQSDAAASLAVSADTLKRFSGVAFSGFWGSQYLLARYGIQNLLDMRSPWRLAAMFACLGASLLGGYRGLVILLGLIILFQFMVEGVYRMRLGVVVVVATAIIVGFTFTFIDRTPLAVQRAFSFLPLERIDSMARLDALGTLDWRLTMWKVVIPEIPQYLWLGKGYSFNGTDYYLTIEAVRRGLYSSFEDTLVSGNYHNGILTLLIPFGIFGFGAFLWFSWAGLWVLRQNLRYGDPEFKAVNTFLLGLFAVRLVFYLAFYGQFEVDFVQFTGAVGLSIALNGGVLRESVAERELIETGDLAPAT